MASGAWLLADSSSLVVGAVCALDREEARHLASVLRRPVGSSVVLADGCGAVADGVVCHAARDRVEVEVLSVMRTPRPAGPMVRLALAILHTSTMDWAVQKSVEVGAAAFIPVIAERSQGGAADGSRRLEHWRRVARQALKQCRRPWGMDVTDPAGIGDLGGIAGPGLRVLADPAGKPVVDLAPIARDAMLLVGPEGGFSDLELGRLDSDGWRRVGLGPHVMRAETAAVVGVAMLGAALCQVVRHAG